MPESVLAGIGRLKSIAPILKGIRVKVGAVHSSRLRRQVICHHAAREIMFVLWSS